MTREITSANNPLVKQLRALATSKKTREQSGTFIIEGRRGIETLLAHHTRQYRLEQLVLDKDARDLPALPDELDTVVLPGFIFEKISDVRTSQGILGVVSRTPVPFEFCPDTGRYLLLDAVSDPGNLGTLIRSAVGAEFDGVLLYGNGVEPYNPKVIRSTMGTFAYCSTWDVSLDDIDRMLAADYALYATTGDGNDSLYKMTFSNKTILGIGSEAHGLSAELMQRASRRVTIPLAKECESLNAAMAGSICMFHIRHGKR